VTLLASPIGPHRHLNSVLLTWRVVPDDKLLPMECRSTVLQLVSQRCDDDDPCSSERWSKTILFSVNAALWMRSQSDVAVD